MLGAVVLSDSLQFADFAVVLKNRQKERSSPSPSPTVEENGGKEAPGSSQSEAPGSSQEKGGHTGSDEPEAIEVKPHEEGDDHPRNTGKPAQTDGSENGTGSGDAPTGTPHAATRAEILSYCDGELQTMWAYYTERVEALEQEARGEYRALPAAQQTKEKKEEIVSSKMDSLYALEDECDARVNQLLSYVGAELRKIGEDTSVISDYRKEYADRKHLMESDYIKRFKKSVS